jgi:DHA2 family methylenomycin A resistance protein-like MFS transporter
MGCGIALSVPPLTSALLGSVEKSRSGVAAGVLNAARQTGSVLGVALFGSLIGQTNDFIFGARTALAISALLLVGAAATTAIGGRASTENASGNTSQTYLKFCSAGVGIFLACCH